VTSTAPTAPVSPPAGWYTDPSGQAQWRYWDGRGWTQHQSGAPATGLPAQPPPVPPQPERPTGFLQEIADAFSSLASQGPSGEQLAAQGRGRFAATPDDPPPATSSPLSTAWIVLAVVAGTVTLVAAVLLIVPHARDNSPDSYISPFFQPASAAVALLLIPVAFYLWRRYWLLVDTPTVEVAGAYPGLCELVGRVQAFDPAVPGWFTNAPCVWVESKVERYQSSGKNSRWVRIWSSKAGSKRFALADPTGSVFIEPPQFNAARRKLLEYKIDKRHRVIESGLMVGDWLYVLGPVHTEPNGALVMSRRESKRGRLFRPPFWIAQSYEGRIASALRWGAVAATIVAVACAVLFTMFETVANDNPTESSTELVIRDSNLLVPALVVGAFFIGLFIVAYWWRLWNRLVGLKHQAGFAWSLIGTSVTQRHDLIGKLVGVVGAAAAHERAAQVSSASGRSGLPDASAASEVQQAVAADTHERGQVMARAEDYPDLKVSENFRQLFHALVAIENRIAAHRRFYNDAVTVLLDQTNTLPGVAMRSTLLGHSRPALLEFDLPTESGAAPQSF